MVVKRYLFFVEDNEPYLFPMQLFDELCAGRGFVERFASMRIRFVEAVVELESDSITRILEIKGRIAEFDQNGRIDERSFMEQVPEPAEAYKQAKHSVKPQARGKVIDARQIFKAASHRWSPGTNVQRKLCAIICGSAKAAQYRPS